MDSSLLSLLNNFAASNSGAGEVARLLAQDAIFVLVGALVIMALVPGSIRGRRVALSAVASAGLGLALGQLLAQLWDRPRPFLDGSGAHPLIAHSADSSFPSDHAIVAFAIAVSLLLWNRRLGSVGLAVAALLCVARVSVGVHYPTDVIAGGTLGAMAAVTMQLPLPSRLVAAVADRLGGIYERLLPGRHPAGSTEG